MKQIAGIIEDESIGKIKEESIDKIEDQSIDEIVEDNIFKTMMKSKSGVGQAKWSTKQLSIINPQILNTIQTLQIKIMREKEEHLWRCVVSSAIGDVEIQ